MHPIISRFFMTLLVTCLLACSQAVATPANSEVKSFKECVERGYLVLRTLPAKCVTPDGKSFTFVPHKPIDIGLGMEGCRDLCGDGDCQEIVCMADGCPCAESPESCPKDCSSDS